MAIKKLITLGLVGLTTYKLYQKKDKIVQDLKHFKQKEELIKNDISNIKSNVDAILAQKDTLQNVTNDLNYKVRVFKEETQVRVDEINQRMAKYQNKSN